MTSKPKSAGEYLSITFGCESLLPIMEQVVSFNPSTWQFDSLIDEFGQEHSLAPGYLDSHIIMDSQWTAPLSSPQGSSASEPWNSIGEEESAAAVSSIYPETAVQQEPYTTNLTSSSSNLSAFTDSNQPAEKCRLSSSGEKARVGSSRRFLKEQTEYLEEYFWHCKQNLTDHHLTHLAATLSLTPTQVRNWFRNRKTRAKREGQKNENSSRQKKDRSKKAGNEGTVLLGKSDDSQSASSIIKRLQGYIPTTLPLSSVPTTATCHHAPSQPLATERVKSANGQQGACPSSIAGGKKKTLPVVGLDGLEMASISTIINPFMYCGSSLCFTPTPLESYPVAPAQRLNMAEFFSTLQSWKQVQWPSSTDILEDHALLDNSLLGSNGEEDISDVSGSYVDDEPLKGITGNLTSYPMGDEHHYTL